MKKIIATSVLASSLLFPAFANAEGLSFPVKMTVEKKVDIRKGATDSYSIVQSLNPGQQVNIIDEFTNSTGEKWYRVDLGSVKGWGLSTQFSNQGVSFHSGYATTIASNVQMRKGATTAYAVVETLQKGIQVKIIDNFKNSLGEVWYRIEKGNKTGWILSTNVEVNSAVDASTTEQKTIMSASTIRKGATSSYAVVGSVRPNQKVAILDTFTNSMKETWYRIKSGTLTGWVISTAFEPANSDSSVTPEQPAEPDQDNSEQQNPEPDQQAPSPVNQTLYVNTANGEIRSGASTNYKIVENLPLNTLVTVVDTYINASKETWFRVQSPSGKLGWIPETKLSESKQQTINSVYALKNAVIRRGASPNYAITLTLKGNEKLQVLSQLNGWFNVKTTTGKTGWILASQTSQLLPYSLVSPTTYTEGDNSYIVWKKSADFKFTYSTTTNQLKLYKGIGNVDLPSFKVKGIQSIEKVPSGSETSLVLTFEPGYTFTLRNYKDKVSIKVLPTGLLGKKIIVDAGHGGHDVGALGPKGLKEKDANLGTALLVKEELEKAGAIVTLTRSTDVFLELSQRTAIANNSDADVFISIHSDSFSTTSKGSTTYYNSTVSFNGPRSRQLAGVMQKNLISTLNTYNRGVKEQEFYVNRMNELPSILVEMAFISNPNEEALLRSDEFRRKVALGITQGLQEYYSNF